MLKIIVSLEEVRPGEAEPLVAVGLGETGIFSYIQDKPFINVALDT